MNVSHIHQLWELETNSISNMGVHFQVVAYKELATFPNEWEVWKKLLQSVINSQMWKSVQVFLLVGPPSACEGNPMLIKDSYKDPKCLHYLFTCL
jgi:hypothetical protein